MWVASDCESWGVQYRITRGDLFRLSATGDVPGRGSVHHHPSQGGNPTTMKPAAGLWPRGQAASAPARSGSWQAELDSPGSSAVRRAMFSAEVGNGRKCAKDLVQRQADEVGLVDGGR